MKGWHDEDLILHLYGEHPRRDEISRDLAHDPELARRFAELARDLAPFDLLEAADPRPGFETRLWAALEPRLAERRPTRLDRLRDLFAVPAPWRLAALAAVLVAALGFAFWAGRQSVVPDVAPAVAAGPDVQARERLLFASLAGHLESSGLLLTDLANAPAGGTLAEEQAWAATLLESNRLYRQAAERAGQRRIVALLDELEPLLLELAHHPDDAELDELQHHISENDLLFKVRVVGNQLGTSRTGASQTGYNL